MDKLTNLVSFARVVECGSISSASRDLNLSQPAVSQHLKNLEQDLGLRLLNRTTRSMVLTEAGERYYQQIRPILERLDEADKSVKQIDQQMEGMLKISAPLSFVDSPISQFLIDFKMRYPDLVLDLDLTDDHLDVISSKIDLAIRLGPVHDDRLIVRPLGQAYRRLAATKAYLDRHGRPDRPEELCDHSYILCSHLSSRDVVPLTDVNGRTVQARVKASILANNSGLVRQMCQAGLGIGLAHRWLLEPLVLRGDLEYVLPDWSYDPQVIHALYPSNPYIPTKVRRFVDELENHMQAICPIASKIGNATD